MTLLSILKYPDPRLKLVAEPVNKFDSKLQTLSQDLFATMYAEEGVGLAATQVNVQQRIVVIDVSDHQNQGYCLVNPVITQRSGVVIHEEGCLSFPGIYGKVKRDADVTVTYYDLQGNQQSMQATGLLAICIQHEIDHLDGITFYDHLSSLKKKLLRNKLKKQRDEIL